MCIQLYVYVCRGQKTNLGCHSLGIMLVHLAFGEILPLNLELTGEMSWLALYPQGFSWVYPPSVKTVSTTTTRLFQFYFIFIGRLWGLKLGPHSCVANTLPRSLFYSSVVNFLVERIK